MNLQLVPAAAVTVRIKCVRCHGTSFVGKGGHKVYADLDGVPFVDYYCEPCRAHILVTSGGREGICADALRYGREPLKLGSTMIEVRIGERSPLLTQSFETFNRGQA
jgi:hypothetical protein